MTDNPGRSKRRAAALSVGSNIILVLGKLTVGLITRSVAIISEAVHSAMDLLAAIIAFVAVSLSDRPPDQKHPHGHGKIENLSGAIEALLIFGAVLFIGYEAIAKLLHGGSVQHILLGTVIMGVSAVLNTIVSWHLQRVGRRTDSDALLADAAHLRTDVYTSLGVLLGLGLVHFTKLQWLDPVSALAVGLLIVWEAWQITRRSVGTLLDESLPPDELAVVEQVMRRNAVSYHAVRSRKSGATRTIDLHLDVSPKATAAQIHDLCDHLEEDIRKDLPGTQVLIHPEPDGALDKTRSIQEQVEHILKHHRSLFHQLAELHTHESSEGICVSMRLVFSPQLTLSELHQIHQHLAAHIEQQMPDVQLFIQPLPDSKR